MNFFMSSEIGCIGYQCDCTNLTVTTKLYIVFVINVIYFCCHKYNRQVQTFRYTPNFDPKRANLINVHEGTLNRWCSLDISAKIYLISDFVIFTFQKINISLQKFCCPSWQKRNMDFTENATVHIDVFTSNDTDFNATTTLSDIDGNDDDAAEIARIIQITVRPVLIVLGTVGNCLSFYVMRRGSLKKRSYCFYMAMLALADTGT